MIYRVALAVAPYYCLDYKSDIELDNYQRVLVSIGKRPLVGFIIAKGVIIDYDIKKVKPIIEILDKGKPFISKDIQKLVEWAASYYHSDIYSVLKLALPNEYFKKVNVEPRQQEYLEIDRQTQAECKLTSKQQQLIRLFEQQEIIEQKKVQNEGFSSAIIKALIAKKVLSKKRVLAPPVENKFLNRDCPRKLSLEQQQALNTILTIKGFAPFLLYGVTGSGKTEIYLQLIAEVVKKSEQALILIPEINLTPQTLERFQNRFPNRAIVSLHSRLSEKDRLTNWHYIKKGIADIVISTRSGVLADFKSLGVIIVDEEHDSSFKQQTSTIRYHARDIAVLRARFANIPVILGSATPSIESYYNAQCEKYKLLKLQHRVSKHQPAKIQIIDLTKSMVNDGVSDILLSSLKRNLELRNQSLVFVNKLGFARALICKQCGSAVECKRCDKPFTLHTKPRQYLECHFCGSNKQIVTRCESCGASELFPYGVGTEKIQQLIEEKIPNVQTIRFDRQNIKNNTLLDEALADISLNKVDIVIGTQMIAKGHHFEGITLVGLINVDGGFYSPDFHAVEKTAQLIIQVAGRAGRGDRAGIVLLQTYQSENELLKKLISLDYLRFLDYLLEQRKYANYPPYTYQAQVLAESTSEREILDMLAKIYQQISLVEGISVSRALPAIHLKKNNVYRYSLLITSKSRAELSRVLAFTRKIIESQNIKKIKIYFDVDNIEL